MYTVIGREGCSNCEKIKKLLSKNGVNWEYKLLDEISKIDKFNLLNEAKRVGQLSLPIILKDGVFIPTVDVESQYQ